MATPKLRLISNSQEFLPKKYRALSTSIHIPSGRYVAPGARIMTQSTANSMRGINSQTLYQHHKPSLFVKKSFSATNHQPKQLKVHSAA
ncbi:hypothetical protein C7B62_13565 [Pleurocapsa sp. CCALA 161]|uniref:hypothetical protein n=1 Tax=Pleurocapsa sp. CCALA 161 TaxID=2107688 RepID=UPI000D071912|nr:hypothetical protein [Pleurocapsa sp. CCALA 161]PSB09309.1 hypothetical protein C7B62_13565 [Pleurocapsa sp. CCALA 161]